MKKRNLTFKESCTLAALLAKNEQDPHPLFHNVMWRMRMNYRSWRPYGGLPRGASLVFLDPRWEGDRQLITLCETMNIGTPED